MIILQFGPTMIRDGPAMILKGVQPCVVSSINIRRNADHAHHDDAVVRVFEAVASLFFSI